MPCPRAFPRRGGVYVVKSTYISRVPRVPDSTSCVPPAALAARPIALRSTRWEDRRPAHRPVGVTSMEGERMDEVSAEAKLASEGVAPSLTVAVPRLEVQRAVDEKQEAD